MRSIVVLVVGTALGSGLGCSANKQAAGPVEGSVAEVRQTPAAPANKTGAVAARTERQGTVVDYSPVLFEFDSTQIRPDARPRLDAMAEALRSNPDLGLTIEGHADERGTTEYNMSLGERRAQVVRDYLKALGASPQRLRIVSYGEERPAATGQDEQTWARNRRSEFVPAEQGKPTASR